MSAVAELQLPGSALGLAARRTAVAGQPASSCVLALLAGRDVENAVATGLVGEAIARAAVARDRVAVVALLAANLVDIAVRARLVGQAVRRAPIAGDQVAVVADLTGVGGAIAARFENAPRCLGA